MPVSIHIANTCVIGAVGVSFTLWRRAASRFIQPDRMIRSRPYGGFFRSRLFGSVYDSPNRIRRARRSVFIHIVRGFDRRSIQLLPVSVHIERNRCVFSAKKPPADKMPPSVLTATSPGSALPSAAPPFSFHRTYRGSHHQQDQQRNSGTYAFPSCNHQTAPSHLSVSAYLNWIYALRELSSISLFASAFFRHCTFCAIVIFCYPAWRCWASVF